MHASNATAPAQAAPPAGAAPHRLPALPLLLLAALLGLAFTPRIAGSDALLRTFGAVAALMFAWSTVLWIRDRGRADAFGVLVPPLLRTHVVQAVVQIAIYTYWAWYWPAVARQVPLFIAQAFFLCTFDALLAWSRGRAWRFGMGPLPIVLSTNVFLWFRDDWFFYQFLLLAVAALGKEFITWQRDGRRRHVFNPSAFALALFSIVLIVTDSTHVTWAVDIATTIFRPPFIYLQIFLLGLVVQFLFGTVLMTLSAAAVLYLFNVVYTAQTGVYYFLDSNISAAVFLGFHLLVTDPSTSPRSNLGKIAFGGLYGAAICVLYAVLGELGAPQLYDKLLPIPLLNLCVRGLDRLTSAGVLGRLSGWEGALPARRTNLVYMGCWAALFAVMYGTGFVEAPHPGRKASFWREAHLEGRPGAGEKLLQVVSTRAAKGHAVSLNQLGSLIMDGELLERDVPAAARWFALACEGGSDRGCVNLARVFVFEGVVDSPAALDGALDRFEEIVWAADPVAVVAARSGAALDAEADDGGAVEDEVAEPEGATRTAGEAAFLLGLAHETGRGRPADEAAMLRAYARGVEFGNLDAAKGLARNLRSSRLPGGALAPALDLLRAAAASADAEACLVLAFALDSAPQLVRPDDPSVADLLQRACDLGHTAACEALANGRR